jgi:hypothetical protein
MEKQTDTTSTHLTQEFPHHRNKENTTKTGKYTHYYNQKRHQYQRYNGKIHNQQQKKNTKQNKHQNTKTKQNKNTLRERKQKPNTYNTHHHDRWKRGIGSEATLFYKVATFPLGDCKVLYGRRRESMRCDTLKEATLTLS